jgi:hypothetical protein
MSLALIVVLLVAGGCQTRQISASQRGMTEEEVRGKFGEPGRVVAGGAHFDRVWYYYAFMAFRYREWVWVPRGSSYGGDLVLIPTSTGIRYPKFRIVFTNGVVYSAAELAPPDL